MDILKKVIDAQNSLYELCGFRVNDFAAESESEEYYAHSYLLDGKSVRFRIAKKTPTKTGWFVSIWKRNAKNIIAPYESADQVDFIVVNIVDKNKVGHFVFPKSVLVEKNVFSTKGKEGKRAMRVYSPWDEAQSAQALRTQKWQGMYFVDITSRSTQVAQKIKALYSA